ncbi:LOW QUALITY PROTEIN: hypothetical protein BC938DRAFT_476427 [Jimgerdemannia flammicorona]|uniref:Galactose oxidase n=1 Tax=Jimgerdemannia flammicorona TaxID=994334 RepID=A0A433QZ41_9FUNG|nr:LOW QUALITY PROTEIN: hypothetical protein BC938DRAFT_476427 [Jimgerdemannia flammicorona]
MTKTIFQTLLVFLAAMTHQATAFTPTTQWAQTAVLIDDIIYVYGGARSKINGITNLYTLNISQSWNTSAPAWADHSSDAGNFTVPKSAYHSMWPSDDEESFYVWGGGNSFSEKPKLSGFAQYNIANKTWSLPSGSAAVSVPLPRRETVASWTASSVVYIWAGLGDGDTGYSINGTSGTKIFTEMISFDTVNLAWSVLSIPGPLPIPRILHTSTMLPNNQIVMIGGLYVTQTNITSVNRVYANLTEIPVFDTTDGTWILNNASGNVPMNRRAHAAVLAISKRQREITSPRYQKSTSLKRLTDFTRTGEDEYSIIICCGGTKTNNVNLNDVAVLDTATWQWTQPSVNGTPPPARYGSSSIMVNGQMIVMFGSGNSSALNDIAVLDTRITPYQWATQFDSDDDEWIGGQGE